jgi:hypothetical protein
VRGHMPDLLRFVSFLAQGQYKSFVINGVAVAPDGPSAATVRLTVYYSVLVAAPVAVEGGAPSAPVPTTNTTPTPAAVPTLYRP